MRRAPQGPGSLRPGKLTSEPRWAWRDILALPGALPASFRLAY
jgi:hypothetical protein